MTFKFTLQKISRETKARTGMVKTTHSAFETPIFMPVGTKGAVKTLLNQQLIDLNVQIILANTYHLMLRPGKDILDRANGLHSFMNWPRSLLTDSGGFQVFSLAALNEINDNGVYFQSHIDGTKYFLGPKESMDMQKTIGADIVMAFDQCTPYPCEKKEVEKAAIRTLSWAQECQKYPLKPHQTLFAITQGGLFADIRQKSTRDLAALDFAGYAIGGLSVGEPANMMYEALDISLPLIPTEKPRYLMGVGTPLNILEAVKRGVDMFDCVLPTRNARNGTAFTWAGKINIRAGRYAKDFTPLDPLLDCYVSQFTKAYLRHLLNVNEITGLTLITIQNVAFYLDFMKQMRQAILQDKFTRFYEKIRAIYPN